MVVMRVGWKSQHHGIAFVQIYNEIMAAARKTGARGPWIAEKRRCCKKTYHHVGEGEL